MRVPKLTLFAALGATVADERVSGPLVSLWSADGSQILERGLID